MKPVYVIDAVRTPVGKYGGALSTIRPDDLLANVIVALLQRNESVDINAIEEVINVLLALTASRGKRQLAAIFMDLVDRAEWPEYYEVRVLLVG